MMDILALDIGTHTGWAYNRGRAFHAGTWDLASASEITTWGKQRLTRRQDPRACRMLDNIRLFGYFDAVVFEDVQFVRSQMQGQLWASLRAAVWLAHCEAGATFLEAVPVATLKKFATGGGSATKERMCGALIQADNRYAKAAKEDCVRDLKTNTELDDNAVDAIWLWKWGQQNLGRLKA